MIVANNRGLCWIWETALLILIMTNWINQWRNFMCTKVGIDHGLLVNLGRKFNTMFFFVFFFVVL